MHRRLRRLPHSAKPNAARRASALTALLVLRGGVQKSAKWKGRLKAAALVLLQSVRLMNNLKSRRMLSNSLICSILGVRRRFF